MIQFLARHSRKISLALTILFYLSIVLPAYGMQSRITNYAAGYRGYWKNRIPRNTGKMNGDNDGGSTARKGIPSSSTNKKNINSPSHTNIGGPAQPEMSSFKTVSADNLVNLFTGDFNYNIPLLDVGGYPVNIFYDGGVNMEQEASWVGLGWNINPGTVSRNMRGVPDDFNGQDTLVQTQVMKPNKTWGFNLNADLEGVGIKFINGKVGVGISFNNYLGPALDLTVKGGATFSLAGKTASEKMVPGASVGYQADLNSRSGLTLSPYASLTFGAKKATDGFSFGTKLSTSYNSRSGIKELQLSEQMSYNYKTVKNGQQSVGGSMLSTSISFTRPSYVPSIRMPITNSAFSGHFQLGAAMFGGYASGEAEVFFQKAEVVNADMVQRKPMIGYLYYQKAKTNPTAVMDFTRFNDGEVTPNTTVLSVPQYSYDVFSIQGEGTGGSIRAYRNDMGYVRDNISTSKDKSTSIGADIGIPGHYGANVNVVKTPSVISEWNFGNGLRNAGNFGFTDAQGTFENVYFRNPGENSVLNSDQYNKVGGTDLVRFKLGGSNSSPTIEPKLERFTKSGTPNGILDIVNTTESSNRKKRSQVIDFLTAQEASVVGLDKVIRSYSDQTLIAQDTLVYESIPRVGGYRKAHHISQINVTESDGKRYVYSIPVYNIVQKDFSFSAGGTISSDNSTIGFNTSDTGRSSQYLQVHSSKDGYIQTTETPAYAHSFLLTGLLSPNYVDVTNNGITEDDLGEAVKFNYTRVKQNTLWAVHKWRTPLTTSGNTANYNEGNRTEDKDDKGIISYGERESWYLQSIESKTMIAVFRLGNRNDGKGTSTPTGGIDVSDNSLKKLDRIDLYSKADLRKNGQTAKPIKSVFFEYSYVLCNGIPDNQTGGKLTLEKIYFTYNGQTRANKNQYVFVYGSNATSNNSLSPIDNPGYKINSSDRWGTYKNSSMNPQTIKNSEYPYSIQDKTKTDVNGATIDNNASAWMLKKVLLPSGGQIEVQYESDDYAFVQNKRATDMMEILGFGPNATTVTNRLYNMPGTSENDYVFIKVPVTCTTKDQVYQYYLQGINQIAFKLAVVMPKGYEYIRSYATIADYGVYDASAIWVKVNRINGYSPMSITALEYLRERLPGQAFEGYDVSGEPALQQVVNMLGGMLSALGGAFKDPVKYLREQGKARTVIVNQSFARLNDPDGFKYGGGYRVKSVKLKDSWDRMTQQYGSSYGQEYNYTTTETFNGTTRTISSGVASYEPTIGGEENPFQTIIQVADRVPLGPTSYGSIEMPVLDAFFPAPSVGYSKVTVRSLQKNIPSGKKSRSGVGKQVTEYYTAKDFPVYYSNTSLDPAANKEAHQSSLGIFFYKSAFDSRALSQGFLIETNDMHGKMKSQSSYAENDTNTRINYTENFYRNTGSKGMNEKFDFAYNSQNGQVQQGNMGIDIELMTDNREFQVRSNSVEVQAQVDWIVPFPPVWLPFIWPVVSESENTFRSVTTTKVINYHSILDSIVVIDKGSQVSTKNLVYDAETGDVLVNRTNNEFNDPIYSTSYPAWWAYSGMGLAYKNIQAFYSGATFYDGRLTSGGPDQSVFESGDELYITAMTTPGSGCAAAIASPNPTYKVWVLDKNKSTTSLNVAVKDLMFIDITGKPFTANNVSFKIIRSGRRNFLNDKANSVISLSNPVKNGYLAIDNTTKVVSGSAVAFKEKWSVDCFSFATISNPYQAGLLGNFKPYRSYTYYGNRSETNPVAATNIRNDGTISNFGNYWNFSSNNLVPNTSNSNWVWNSELMNLNSKGQEVETKNALNQYTSAQYGFFKSLPLAVTQNAQDNEMAYEGFEDYNYSESLNGSYYCTSNRKLGAFDHVVGYNSNPYGVSYNVTNNGNGTQTLTVYFSSIPAGTCASTLAYYNGSSWSSGTSGPTSPRTYTMPVGNWQYRLVFECSNVTVNLDASLYNTSSIKPHSGKQMMMVLPNEKDTIPFYINGYGAGYNTDNIQFNFPTEPLIQTNTHGDTLGVKGTATISQTPGTTTNGSLSGNSYLAGFNVSTNCGAAGPCGGITFNGGTNLTAYYVPTQSTSLVMYLEGQYNFSGSCGTPTLSIAGGGVSIYDDATNSLVATGGSGGCTVTGTRCAVNITNYSFTVGHVYRIVSNLSFYGSVPACGQFGSTSLTITNYITYNDGSWIPITCYKNVRTDTTVVCSSYTKPIEYTANMSNPGFGIPKGKKMLFSAWVREECGNPDGSMCFKTTYDKASVVLKGDNTNFLPVTLTPTGPIVDGWQKVEGEFMLPSNFNYYKIDVIFTNSDASKKVYFDDIRVHPFNANMKSYVYDPVNLRLVAQGDENNYTSFYEYDEEGGLIRVKAETAQGIKTIKETRSAKQKNITTLQ